MASVLELRGIEKRFETPRGPVQVLRAVTLELHRGEFVALTGPSGSGKTTLLNIVALLDAPTAGQMSFHGQNIVFEDAAQARELRKRHLGMVFQKFCLLPHRTALDNVLFRCRYLEQRTEALVARASAILDEFGLLSIAHQPARLLSGGEMQRVAIARAMLHEPELLVADEPTGNLDAASAELVMEHLRRLNEKGITIFLVTHNLSLLKFASGHYDCREGVVERLA